MSCKIYLFGEKKRVRTEENGRKENFVGPIIFFWSHKILFYPKWREILVMEALKSKDSFTPLFHTFST